MDFPTPELVSGVRAVVRTLVPDPPECDDLIQESLILLSSLGAHHHFALSWCLQRCRFLVLDRLKAGTSIDSPKRRHLGDSIDAQDEPDTLLVNANIDRVQSFQHVCAHDTFEVLRRHLPPQERVVLFYLAQGWSDSQIARLLHLHPSAITRRHSRIAKTAAKLDIGL